MTVTLKNEFLTVRRGDLIFERTVPLTPTEKLEGYR